MKSESVPTCFGDIKPGGDQQSQNTVNVLIFYKLFKYLRVHLHHRASSPVDDSWPVWELLVNCVVAQNLFALISLVLFFCTLLLFVFFICFRSDDRFGPVFVFIIIEEQCFFGNGLFGRFICGVCLSFVYLWLLILLSLLFIFYYYWQLDIASN